MNVMRASSLQKQSQNNKKDINYCPLLHLVTLMTTFQAKKINSLQQKIDQSIKQFESINIDTISRSSFTVLLESYRLHLQGSQNTKRLIQLLCSKLNKNTNTQLLIQLLQILSKQYHLRQQKQNEIRVLLQIFELGLGMRRKQFKTFNFGVRACEMMVSQREFQKNVNNIIVAIRNEIQFNSNTLTKNISLASQVYGSKLSAITSTQNKKDGYNNNKQSKNQYMKKIMQRSSSAHKRNLSQHNQQRPKSPDCLRLTHQQEGTNLQVSNKKKMRVQNNSSTTYELGQKQQYQQQQQSLKQSKIFHSKTIHSRNSINDIQMKIKSKIKSKSQLLPFYVLLYEIYTICLLRIASQLKKKYYKQGRVQLKDKIIREYPGRNIQQVLFEIQLDKLKVYESNVQQQNIIKQQQPKIFSPSSGRLKKSSKLLSSSLSAGKLSFGDLVVGNSPINKRLSNNNKSGWLGEQKNNNKSTFSYEMSEFQESTISQVGGVDNNNNNSNMMISVDKKGIKVSKFNDNKDLSNNEQKIANNSQVINSRERKSSTHIRTRMISSKSQHKLPKHQVDNYQNEDTSNKQSQKKQQPQQQIYKINRLSASKQQKKSNILQRIKLNANNSNENNKDNNNKEKVNLKKKAKKLIKEKNFLKLNQFAKSSNQSSRRNSFNTNQDIEEDVIITQKVSNEIKLNEPKSGKTYHVAQQKKKQNIVNEQHKLIIEQNLVQIDGYDNNEDIPQIHIQEVSNNWQQSVNLPNTNNLSQEKVLQQSTIPIDQGIVMDKCNDRQDFLVNEQQVRQVQINASVDSELSLDITQIVIDYLGNQLQQSVIDQILIQEYEQKYHQTNKQKQTHFTNDIPAIQKLQNLTQKLQQRTSHNFLYQTTNQTTIQNTNQTNNQSTNPTSTNNQTASDRRIPFCDLSYQQQQDSQRLQQTTVYEIMIMDTPMNGHDLYSSTSRSAVIRKQQQRRKMQQQKIDKQDEDKDEKMIQQHHHHQSGITKKKSIQQSMQKSKKKKIDNLLQLPVGSSDSEQDFIEQRKLNEFNFMQNQIQVLHGFGAIRQMEISVLNCDDDEVKYGQDNVQDMIQVEQIGDYLSGMYDSCVQQELGQFSICGVVGDDDKKIDQVEQKVIILVDQDIDNIVQQYLQSFSYQYTTTINKEKFVLDDIIIGNNDRQQHQKQSIQSSQKSQRSSQSSQRSQSSSFSSSNSNKSHSTIVRPSQQITNNLSKKNQHNISLNVIQNINNNNNNNSSRIILNNNQQQQHNTHTNTNTNTNIINNFSSKNTDDIWNLQNNKYSEQILTIENNNIYSLLNATNIQYSETSKLNINQFSPIMPQKKFPQILQEQKSSKHNNRSNKSKQKQDISILVVNQQNQNDGEQILDFKSNQYRNSIQDDLADMAQLVKHNFIPKANYVIDGGSNHLLGGTNPIIGEGTNKSIQAKRSAIKTNPKIFISNCKTIISQHNLNPNHNNNNKPQPYERQYTKQQPKPKSVQISLLPRQQTIQSNISSNQESHSIIIAHHVLKPQIHVSELLVRLSVFHPQEKKTCQVEKLFSQPINVKDYMKGLQARVTKFLDKLVNQAKQHQRLITNSLSLNTQSLKRSKKQQLLQRSIVDDLINHGHHPFNWQYIVDNINHIDLQQQLYNLKSFCILYKKDQYLTISLMHYVDYKRLIVEYRKNPLQLRPVEISIDLNESINQITSLFNQNNTKIQLTENNNQIKPILQIYNLWCHLETLAISLKNSTSRLKSFFKLNQFVFKTSENITRYNMLIQMIHNDNQRENLVCSDLNLHDRNKFINNFSVIVGYAVKIDKGKSKFIITGKELKTFLAML